MKKLLLLFFLMTISLGFGQGAAPTPPARNSWDVISVFSGAFTDVGSNFYPNWGQSTTYEQVALGGDTALHYSNLNYQGVQFNSAINAASMTKLHIDYWTPSMTTFQVYLIAGGENAVNLTPIQSGWNSVDIDLATSYASRTLNNIIQFKFQSVPFGGTQVYIDNLYFWRPATEQPATLGALSVPAKLVGAAPFALTPPTTNSTGAFTYTSSNLAVATISGSTVTVVGVGTSTITATQAATSSYTSATTTASLVVSYPPPTVAAPTPPTRNSANVISIFSGAYTDISGTNFFPNWGQSTTIADYTVAGNVTKKYSNLNYQGTNLGPINVSLMTNLHIDIWTPDCTAFDFYLINEGIGETKVTLTPTLSGWNSFDIPMSSYAARNLTAINQFKFVGTTGSTVYLDNIYFWKPEGSPTITGFSIPSKVVGGAAFTLDAPTSDSPGTFSYTSSNTSVATISGSTVTIVGIGTSTITATQAAGGGFNSGFVTTTLTVTPTAAPTPTVASSHVISLYSDAYTNVASINWNPNWGQSTQVTDLSIEGNNTRKYSSLNYQGVQLAATLDVSAMQTLHIDIWTPDCTTFSVFLVNQPAPEKSVSLTPTFSGWNSFDINLSEFSGVGGVNLANIGQMKFTGNGTVYVDNIYFSDVVVATAPSITFANSIKLLGDADFTLSASSPSAGAMTYSSSNNSVATISGNTVTIVGVGTTTITVNQAAAGNYLVGTKTATLTVNPSTPTSAAPTPPSRNAWDVISFFSDAYTAQTVTNWNPGWGQGTVHSDETVAGNATKLLSNFDYQGILTAATNVYPMSFLHIDIWTPNCNSFQVFLLAGGENAVTLTPTLSGWNSFDIPMTSYSGRNLLALEGFKLEAPQRGAPKVYYDNLYFWRPATTQPPTIGSFSINARVLGNRDFNLTIPTSNSTGAFTFTSSNTSVATIIGKRVTIVGAGTSIITATQAARGGYSSGSAFASLVVSYPNPTSGPVKPTKDSSRVISIFSDQYTNVTGTAFFQQWGSGTAGSTIQIGTNNIQKYTNFSYVGTQFASPIDASSMEMLHLDIWTPDCTAFKVSLISNGENAVTLTPTLSGWNSFDIDLSLYSAAGRNLAAISQFKFERDGSGTKTVYLDNIYFHNNRTKVSSFACGKICTSVNDSYIHADVVPLATGYKFEVSNGANVRYIETSLRYFNLMMLAGSTYSTTYSIRVSSILNGVYSPYGEACNATTPSTQALTKVSSLECGTTLSQINSYIHADKVFLATGYSFKVVNGTDERIFNTANNYFNLSQLLGGGTYSTTYTISVASKINDTYGEYGAPCNVTTPSSTAKLIAESQEIVSNEVSVQVYPNPFTTNFKFDFSSSSENNVEVVVYDMIGRQLEKLQANSSEMNNLEIGNNYPSGVYNVIVTQGEEVKTLRVIKR